MPLPDDIIPEDPDNPLKDGVQPVAPDESEIVEATAGEQQVEADTSFDEMRQISQATFEAMQGTPAETHEPEPEPEPATPPPENAESPEVRQSFEELKQRTAAEFERGTEPPPVEEKEPAPPEEPPENLQGFMDQGGELPDFDSEQQAGSDFTNYYDADIRHKTLVTDKLLDHTQQINMLIRRLELGGL